MDRAEAWRELNPRETILFLGSGFSAEAKNQNNEYFLVGNTLAERLKGVLGYSGSDSIPLAEIADDFIPEQSTLLYKTLCPLLTATSVSADQQEIINRPWRRVYTTNYDDVYEFGLIQNDKTPESLSFHNAVKKQRNNPQVVHLHGYVHHCNEKNIDEELVLSTASYVRQAAIPQPWFEQFINDIRYANAVVFLGYSLADIPINSLLLLNANIREKTSFITRGNNDDRYQKRVSQYGLIRPIKTSGFADHLRDLSTRPTPARLKNFAAFTEMSPGRDKKNFALPTTVEVRNLLVMGKFRQSAATATFGEAKYVIPRKDKLDQAITAFGHAKTLLVHSRIGNGKSVFCELLNIALSQKGYRCIRTRTDPRLTDNDLRLLKSTQRIVIFSSSFDDAVAVMKQLDNPRSDMHFVVELPTPIAGIRANVVNHYLRGPFERIDLNVLNEQDKLDFEQVLDLAGIRPRDYQKMIAQCRELRDIILKLYKDTTIREMVLKVAQPLWGVPALRRAMFNSFAFKSLELQVSPNMMRALLHTDPLAEFEAAGTDLQPNIEDIFHLQDSAAEPWSSVLAEFLLGELIVADEITEWAIRIATIAGKIKQQELEKDELGYRFREANKVLGKVLQLSTMKRLLGNCPNHTTLLQDMFETARHVDVINVEPLFWLQFAILVGDEQASYAGLMQAQEYLDTAYQRGEKLERFLTYQLDTHALRLLFSLQTHPDRPKDAFTEIEKMERLLERFHEMLSDGSHRSYVLQVLKMAEHFVKIRLQDIMPVDRHRLIAALEKCVRGIEALPDETRLSDQADEVAFCLQRAVHCLRTGPAA